MNLVINFRILLALTLLGGASAFANTATDEGEWIRLEADSLPPEWAEFQEQRVDRPWAVADFVEQRHFRFRRRPVELSGKVWFGRDEGLTLAYEAPREEILRVDENGARLIRNGRVQGAGIPEKAREIPDALLALFRLDFADLEKAFKIEGRVQKEEWSLRMTPLDQDQASIQKIQLSGQGEDLRNIAIVQDRSRRIELELSNIVYPNSLDSEQRARLFP